MVRKSSRQTILVLAAVSLGLAALTGCTNGGPISVPKTLTTKAAASYYLSTTCKADAAAEMFNAAINIVGQSKSNTGPDLDNFVSAANAYEEASQDAATGLDNPKAAWPASVRKSVVVVRDQYMGELPSLEAMVSATQVSEVTAAASEFPDPSKAAAANKLIRSKLGLPSIESAKSCPPPPLSVEPATGLLIKGTGYTFHAPAGWTLPTRPVQGDSYAISARPDAKGFYDTVNVLIQPSNHDNPGVEEENGVGYLMEVVGATAIQVRPHVEIAGELAVHISDLTVHQGVSRRNEQYLVTHDGTDLTITFQFDPAETQIAREALAESVLASWSWT